MRARLIGSGVLSTLQVKKCRTMISTVHRDFGLSDYPANSVIYPSDRWLFLWNTVIICFVIPSEKSFFPVKTN